MTTSSAVRRPIDREELSYYATHGIVTDPGAQAPLLAALPADFRTLRDIVQGLVLHIFWAERYGVTLTKERASEVNLRATTRQLTRLRELTDEPLTQALPPASRLIGNCRDFSTLLAAMLRQHGIPARARCGFGTYFLPNHFEDHWVCEVWDDTESRWRLIDAQLDALQVGILQPDFDPLDVPRDRFIVGGKAWQMIRSGAEAPEKFGIADMHGWGFVRGDLIRDILALNKIEILPWDAWGFMIDDPEAETQDTALMDEIAALSADPHPPFAEVRALYEREPRLHPAPGWTPQTPPVWSP